MNSLVSKGRSSSWSNGEPTYNIARGLRSIYHGSAFLPAFVIDGFYAMLDENGFDFVRQCLRVIEERGIKEQGIYRNCGVTSKVQRLMQLALDKRKNSTDKMNLADDSEWETKTISSAIKTFLRNLPEPLMTFELHNHFINAAKMDNIQQRVGHIHFYVYKLPEPHMQMLELIIRHLRRVADLSSENLMTVGNLGVCFGPTLLRPKEETMAAIMDIKFCNVVVEVLIANCVKIFDTRPPEQVGIPCPPKPTHNLVAVMPPANEQHNLASHSPLSSKSATLSSSSLAESINNQKSSPTDGFGHNNATSARRIEGASPLRTAISSTAVPMQIHSASLQNQSSGTANIGVRHRQPPPAPMPRSKGGAQLPQSLDRNAFESQSSDDISMNSNIFGHHYSIPSTSENLMNVSQYGTNSHNPSVVRNYGPSAFDKGNGVDNSSDSLNSAGSLERSMAASTGSSTSQQQQTASYNKAKMSASYAPCYNPMLSDSAHSNLAAHMNPQDSSQAGSSSGRLPGPSSSNPNYQSAGSYSSSATRIPQVYSNLINPNVPFQPRRVKTLYSCSAGHETELSFEPGQIITNVYESKEEGWLVGTLNGKTGLIPANYVEHIG
ncbi:rhoGAP domain-containing protein [Ditylenchus destructor]|nr:rhoGAP domain-containing protein [Ditylenchus destructor]